MPDLTSRERQQTIAFWLGAIGDVCMMLTGQWAHAFLMSMLLYLIVWSR